MKKKNVKKSCLKAAYCLRLNPMGHRIYFHCQYLKQPNSNKKYAGDQVHKNAYIG